MNNQTQKSTLLVIVTLLITCVALAQPGNEKTLPANSIYQLKVSLEDQSGTRVGLNHYQGQPTIVSMFYASCPHVCPLIISTIKLTEGVLNEQQRSELRVLMISVDPERDTPEILLDTLQRHVVDANRWSMTRPEADDLRTIAGVLGVKYKQLPDGEFNHNSKLILLDSTGKPVAHTSQIGRLDETFVEAVKAASFKSEVPK